MTLPANLRSVIYHITPWIDPFGSVLEDTVAENVNPDDPNELDNNNYKAQEIEIVGALPDLVVTSVTAPDAAQGGDTINVRWTVENQSTGRAEGSWVDRVYVSDHPNPLADGARSLMLAEVARSLPLATGESYNQSVTVDLSPSAAGSFIAVVTDDAQLEIEDDFNAVEEAGEENNATAASATVTPVLADLVVTNVEFEPDLRSGEETTIRYTVTNQGDHRLWSGSEFWRDFLWITPDPAFDRLRASFLGTHIQGAPKSLNPGESYDVEFSTKLPQGLDGEYY